MQYFIGIDVGTSGCKVSVFDEGFQPQAFATQKYAINTPRPGWAEFDPIEIWHAVCETTRRALDQLQIELGKHTFALSFSVFGEGLITSDAEGHVLYPGILCSDLRSVAITERMEKDLGREALFAKTGRTPHPMAVITKIIWLHENRPDLVGSQTRFLDFHGWLHATLGTGLVTDHTSASGTMLFDIDQKIWSPELLAYARIRGENLPESVQAGTSVGHPTEAAARALGFPDAGNVQVAVGAMDQMCNAIGSGTVLPGDIICSMGTVEAVTIVMAPGARTEALIGFNMPRVPSAVEDQYVTHIFLWDGGRSLGWFCDNFAQKQREDAEQNGLSVFAELLGQEPRARDGFFLPHLSGSGMPWQNPLSRGAFLGLTPAFDVVSAAHTIIEGVTFELKINLDNLRSLGMQSDDLRVVGGGSKSDAWLQLKADILERPVSRPAFGEAGCLGAALLAAYGAGFFTDLVAASKNIVNIRDSFQPSARAAYCRKKYEIYKEIYPAIEGINRQIATLDCQ